MSTAEVLIERDGPVMRVQINRPDKKNALTSAMYAALAAAIREGDEDREVRALLVHAAGDVFTSGNDLRNFLEHPPQGSDSPVFQFMTALGAATTPVVMAVQGAAIGIGTTMLFHADLVYAAENTRFHLPFVDLGLVPEFGSSVLLPAMAGYHRAAEFLLLATPFDDRTAREIGLVNAIVPADQLLSVANASARTLAEKPAASVRLTKVLMKRSLAPVVEEAMREESQTFAERLVSPEAKEAFAAFLEKRAPDFSKFS
jgi:enoyl-CoA hydratase/carnithine racemase